MAPYIEAIDSQQSVHFVVSISYPSCTFTLVTGSILLRILVYFHTVLNWHCMFM